MSDVPRSAYRQPVTPSGLESIEKGTLSWLDDDMYNNLNTGVLEQYLEEKNLNVEIMGRGMAWLDTGTPERLLFASNTIRKFQIKKRLNIGNLG